MKKTILEDIARLAGIKQIDENYIYASEEEPAADEASDNSDEVKPEDKGEYDHEGDMAKQDLTTAEEAAEELRSILDGDENLPEWVQAKITKAVDYLDSARDYMKSKDESDEEPVEEAKADKDYDGDGEIESDKEEVWGSRAKAAAKSGKPFGKDDEDRKVAEAIQRMKDIAGLK